ncbi:hypothetical protein NCAS_0G02400 [Naumovozyma castellii]|uniref:Uncharacterized protein n=1 Tax=Naumovozyma castellii TaxID=27288 RepID=G0VI92_NAUCA|nr:hypothetical protein NCAS_0G02400 [Naumovozyma castellii CBS 4309]CCC71127.1 hypothetical protein NCAS_0G02400 [Naumovozyma castellii CBS 4309]
MSLSLENVLGLHVKVTNLLDVVTEGKIYSFNSSNNTITLQTNKKNQTPLSFKIIKCSFIKDIEVIGDKPVSNSFKKQYIKPTFIHIERVTELLNNKIEEAGIKDQLRRQGITEEGEFIFNIIYKTIPDTKWVGKTIVILDDIQVEPPYKVENIKSLHEPNTGSLDLIEKIVANGWKKLPSKIVDSDEDSDDKKGG